MSNPLGEVPPHLVEGIRLFRDGQYFLAHETLEEYWVDAPAGEREFYQGLIQVATAFHHLSRNNPRGATLQFAKARQHLAGYPPAYRGVDVAGLLAFLAEAPDRLRRGEPIPPPELAR